jgi:hypothetical protein
MKIEHNPRGKAHGTAMHHGELFTLCGHPVADLPDDWDETDGDRSDITCLVCRDAYWHGPSRHPERVVAA